MKAFHFSEAGGPEALRFNDAGIAEAGSGEEHICQEVIGADNRAQEFAGQRTI